MPGNMKDPIKAKIQERCPDITDTAMTSEFGIGSRCVFTDAARNKGYGLNKPRAGKIIAETRDRKRWWVRWDGIKSKYRYDKNLLEPSVSNEPNITLSVVLRAIGMENWTTYNISYLLHRWNLLKDNYDDQTEETKRFIGGLLGV